MHECIAVSVHSVFFSAPTRTPSCSVVKGETAVVCKPGQGFLTEINIAIAIDNQSSPYSTSAKKERDTDEKRRNFVRNILKKDSNNHRTPARPTDIAKERKNDARL